MAAITTNEAMDKAFATNEITEIILSHLSMRELLTIVPRVCKTWLAHTKNPALQKHTFRLAETATSEPTTSEPAEESEDFDFDVSEEVSTTDSLDLLAKAHISRGLLRGASPIHGYFNYVSTKLVYFNPYFRPIVDQSYEEHKARCEALGATLHYKTASSFPVVIRPSLLDVSAPCLEMLITQPPLHEARIDVLKKWRYRNGNLHSSSLRLGSCVVNNVRGLRIRNVLKMAKAVLDLLVDKEREYDPGPGWSRDEEQVEAVVTVMSVKDAEALMGQELARMVPG